MKKKYNPKPPECVPREAFEHDEEDCKWKCIHDSVCDRMIDIAFSGNTRASTCNKLVYDLREKFNGDENMPDPVSVRLVLIAAMNGKTKGLFEDASCAMGAFTLIHEHDEIPERFKTEFLERIDGSFGISIKSKDISEVPGRILDRLESMDRAVSKLVDSMIQDISKSVGRGTVNEDGKVIETKLPEKVNWDEALG